MQNVSLGMIPNFNVPRASLNRQDQTNRPESAVLNGMEYTLKCDEKGKCAWLSSSILTQGVQQAQSLSGKVCPLFRTTPLPNPYNVVYTEDEENVKSKASESVFQNPIQATLYEGGYSWLSEWVKNCSTPLSVSWILTQYYTVKELPIQSYTTAAIQTLSNTIWVGILNASELMGNLAIKDGSLIPGFQDSSMSSAKTGEETKWKVALLVSSAALLALGLYKCCQKKTGTSKKAAIPLTPKSAPELTPLKPQTIENSVQGEEKVREKVDQELAQAEPVTEAQTVISKPNTKLQLLIKWIKRLAAYLRLWLVRIKNFPSDVFKILTKSY